MKMYGNFLDSYCPLDYLVIDGKDSWLYAGVFQKENYHQSEPAGILSPLSSEEILKEVKSEFHWNGFCQNFLVYSSSKHMITFRGIIEGFVFYS